MANATTEPRPEDGTLDRSLVHGIAWTGGSKWAAQLLSWLCTFVVARVLTPDDYGLVGVAAVYCGFIQLVSEFGLTAAIVFRRHLSRTRIAELGGLALGLALVVFACAVAGAWPVAAFYHQPKVRGVIVVLSLSLLVGAAQLLPRAILFKELRFRVVALAEAGGAVTGAITTLLLALSGAGYWALAVGPVVGQGTTALGLWRARPHPLLWPRRIRDLAGEIAFGWRILGAQIAWYAYSNADFAILGRVLGAHALGLYTLGWQIATLPVEKVSTLVNQVAPPVIAAAHSDRAALQRLIERITTALALVTFPASIGLALVADRFVLGILGEKWAGAILPLQLLALYGGLRSIATLWGIVLAATGHERENLRYNLWFFAVLVPGFYLGTRWGPAGVAFVWIFGYPLVAIPLLLRRMLLVVGMSFGRYVRAVLKPALAACIMVAAVLGVREVLPATLAPHFALVLLIAAGATSYVAFVLWHYRETIRDVAGLLRASKAPDA